LLLVRHLHRSQLPRPVPELLQLLPDLRSFPPTLDLGTFGTTEARGNRATGERGDARTRLSGG
jgi:hypothetical protein